MIDGDNSEVEYLGTYLLRNRLTRLKSGSPPPFSVAKLVTVSYLNISFLISQCLNDGRMGVLQVARVWGGGI